jgi:heme/copper-type cytochrome/quinol oxidase subunit 4
MTERIPTAPAPVAPDHRLTAATGGDTAKNVIIWAAMLLIVALEVVVTYQRPAMPVLIGALLALAAVQAFLGLMYFMHLRHERAVLGWSLVGALLFVLTLMNQLWPDALRVFRLRLHD